MLRAFPSRVSQIAAAVVVVAGLADSRLVAYYNSWYDEPWTLILVIAIAAWLAANAGRRAVPPAKAMVITVLAVLLVTSKTQNAALAVPLAFTVAVLVAGRGRHKRRAAVTRLVRPAVWAAAVLAAAIGYVALQSPVFAGQSQYDLIFSDLLVHSADPAATLSSIGLPAQMVRYRGTNAYEPSGGFDTPAFSSFERHGGKVRVLTYLATHPGTAAEALGRAATAGWQANLSYLGYRTRASGAPAFSGACEPCVYSSATADVSPAGPAVTIAVYVLGLGVAWQARRKRLGGLADVLCVLAAISAFSLVSAAFGEGAYEEIKHLYLFYIANLLIVAASAGAGAEMLQRRAVVSSRFAAISRRWRYR